MPKCRENRNRRLKRRKRHEKRLQPVWSPSILWPVLHHLMFLERVKVMQNFFATGILKPFLDRLIREGVVEGTFLNLDVRYDL